MSSEPPRRPRPPRATRPRRRALGWAAAALLLSFGLGLAALHDYRGWDTSYYLAQTSSLAEDGDVDLRDDLLHVNREPRTLERLLTTLHPNGALQNTFAIGSSLVWLPVYAATLPLRALTATPAARWSRLQLAGLHLLSLALMVWLLWIFDRWLRRLGVGRRLAALAAVALVLGTPLVLYGFRAYTGSHLASAVAVMLLVLATLELGDRPTPGVALLWGVALGLVFLCRWQDVVKGVLVLAPLVALYRRGLPAGRWLGLAAAAAAGALPVAGLQLHAWLLERGEILTLPQGAGYLDLASPEIGRFLLSGLAGLLPWSPIFALGLAGLLLPWRVRLPPVWRWLALALLLFDVYLNAAVVDWWGGAGYGPRRMVSAVPLVALGLANLARRRRARPALVAALALCCLWGMVTVHLRLSGLRDLAILVQGRPSSAPGAEREGGAQPSPAEARAVAASWPLQPARVSYFAGAQSGGRLLTAAIAAAACLLVGWALGRARAPGAPRAVLLAVLALALAAHLRLLAGGAAGAEDRRLWRQLSAAARGRAGALPAAAVAAAAGGEGGRADARRFLLVSALRRERRDAEARELAASLAGYPFGTRLLQDVQLEPGARRLLSRLGLFHRVRPERGERALVVARRVGPRCDALVLRLEVERVPAAPGASYRLLSWGFRGRPPLAVVEAEGADRIVLRTALATETAALDWTASGATKLELEWDPEAARSTLSASGPDGAAVRLAAPAPAAAGAGRFGVVVGAAPAPGRPAPLGTRFSNLWLSARDVCPEE